MKSSLILSLLSVLLVALFFNLGCGQAVQLSEVNTSAELANQMGDVMASVDEAGKGTTAIAASTTNQVFNANLDTPVSVSAACDASQFGSCNSNQMVRNFGGCTIGGYALAGTTTMTWTGGSNCSLSAPGQAIRINPNYSVSSNNLSLTTTKTGTHGVTLTWDSGTGTSKVFKYTNDGINRTLKSNGTTLLSIDTVTTSPITIVGTTRGGRSITSGGSIQITNNTSGEVCNFSPNNNITWGNTSCNCATSGQWVGSCSTTGSVVMTINGCGTAEVVYSEDGATKVQTVSLDRCVSN